MFIYKLIFASGKIYIGQTIKTVEHRYNHHRNTMNAGSLLPVHCAWRKYGDPLVETLSSHVSLDDLNKAEIAAILEHQSVIPSGYNLAGGGSNSLVHPQTKVKIGNANRGRMTSPEVRAKIAEASRLRWLDPEYREKVARGVQASFTPERRALLAQQASERHKGVKKSPEVVAAMRARVCSDETRQKMSQSAKKRVRGRMSQETRAKMAESAKLAWMARRNNPGESR